MAENDASSVGKQVFRIYNISIFFYIFFFSIVFNIFFCFFLLFFLFIFF